jgi:hypothetical protein
VVLDASAPEEARLHAARRLGLDAAVPARAVALPGGRDLPGEHAKVPRRHGPAEQGADLV